MNISDFLSTERIVPDIRASKKSDVIRELAGRLAAAEGFDQGAVTRVLLEREQLGSTGLGDGIAIPHGKLQEATRITGCLGRSRKGLDFESEDEKPTHFVFVLIAPQGAAGEHLKALARISRLFRDSAFRNRLLGAKSALDMQVIIEQEDTAVVR